MHWGRLLRTLLLGSELGCHRACRYCPEASVTPAAWPGLCQRCLNRVVWLGQKALNAEGAAVLRGGAAEHQDGPPGPYGFGKASSKVTRESRLGGRVGGGIGT